MSRTDAWGLGKWRAYSLGADELRRQRISLMAPFPALAPLLGNLAEHGEARLILQVALSPHRIVQIIE
jgi:hypothetical protein